MNVRTLFTGLFVLVAFAGGIWLGRHLRRPTERAPITHGPGNDVVEMDFNGDGVSDVFYYYSNDVAFKLQMDRNFDGRLDYLEFYTNGVPVRSASDDNSDGLPDMWVDYKWGQPAAARQDTDCNGVPDVLYFYTNGVAASIFYHPNGTGAVVRETKYVGGRLSEDIYLGGGSNALLHLTYDPCGRVLDVPESLWQRNRHQ